MEHQGAVLEKVVRRSGVSITSLARSLDVNRRTIYNWFAQPCVCITTLRDIGKILQYDFSKHFPNYSFTVAEKEDSEMLDRESPDLWKNKYLELLERYNDLLVKSHKKAVG